MQYLVVCLVAFLTSGLTLFSGFGLGTLLLPAFLIFFPVELAVAMTAIVHFLNNVFKLVLLGRYASRSVVIRFGVAAMIAAFIGARVLFLLSDVSPLAEVDFFGAHHSITPIKLTMALLIIAFAGLEVLPSLRHLAFDRKYLPVGGFLSGFFGGLSGHQGALRSAFLVRSGLSKEAFIASGVVISVFVDLTRLTVYSRHFAASGFEENLPLILAATFSAFVGAYLGNRLISKITLDTIQVIVSVLLFVIAAGLGLGLI